MLDWNSSQYLKFSNERTKPAIDLAMHINNNPRTILDVGCGPGNSTNVLRSVFPNASLVGIDNSENMIEKARIGYPDIDFKFCDAHSIKGKYDLLFSNACLQWIPFHHAFIPYLMKHLNDDGILAVQIPMNGDEPLYRLIKDVVNEPEWNLKDVQTPINETLTLDEYYDILCSCSSSFDTWEIKYYHKLKDHKSLVDWVKGTRLRPYLDVLDEGKKIELENELVERANELYPFKKDGNVVLKFRRFFFIAHR